MNMAMASRTENDTGPARAGTPDASRRCIVTREPLPRAELIRFALGPDGTVVPDLSEKLPGRGLWVRATRDIVDRAVAEGAFARAARAPAKAPADLADRVELLLRTRCLDLVAMARRAGDAVAGFEKVRAAAGKPLGVLLTAADAGDDVERRVRALATGDLPEIRTFSGDELGAVFGRDRTVHIALAPGKLAERLIEETGRLSGFVQTPTFAGLN